MDFYRIVQSEPDKKGVVSVFPDYRPNGFSDLMIRGGSFYAVWDEENNTWSTDEYRLTDMVDSELHEYREKMGAPEEGISRYSFKYMVNFSSGTYKTFKQFTNIVADRYVPLDRKLVFKDQKTTKEDYVTRSLPYKLEHGSTEAWDELVDVLYSPLERQKIEWAIGAIVSGDSRTIQKFLVFYGSAGTGKSTILNIIEKLFTGYVSTFDAKALGSNNGTFSTEAFMSNPLVAIQHDGDLSRIEDNTRLNSIVAHEDIMINPKYMSAFPMRIDSFLLMGTNKPVKITDARSGLIRRLIDVHPTGQKVTPDKYLQLYNQIDFELGAIASKCLDIYRSLGKNYYNAYQPVEMMTQTDYFYNFIASAYDIFKSEDGISFSRAWEMFNNFKDEQGIEAKGMPKYKFREELKNYFRSYEQRAKIGDHWEWNYYSGFDTKSFEQHDMSITQPEEFEMEDTTSILDEVLEEMPAQYGRTDKHGNEVPEKRWDWVKTKLKDISTTDVHYVRPPLNHVVIDFDLLGEDGNKSLERNLQEAASWPATYGEISKGGNGVHLHYLYDGDTDELSSRHSEGIEVKIFRGNASLRRKLSRCNNTPIATISSGLPLKEKKVLNDDIVKTEKGLRQMIERNLNKEFHGATKPSIDFIYKNLEDAYASGLTYDVTDLKARIINFAMNSSNQSQRCLETVTRMRFTNDGGSEAQPDPRDDRLMFYDIECYPNLFGIVYSFEDEDAPLVKMVNPSPSEVEALMKYKLVGFNNRKYDNHMIYAAMLGYSNEALYALSTKLVSNAPNSTFGAAYNLSYTDVYDYASEKMTLKKWQIKYGMKHVEMDLPWDKPVPEDRIEDVMAYCANDVETLKQLHKKRKGDFTARLILAALSGLTPNNTTNQHSGAIIFGANKRPQTAFKYTNLDTIFPGYTYEKGVSTYQGEKVGEGGYVYAEPGIYDDVAILDVASMHPTSIEELNLFGNEYTQKFSDMKSARVAIKRGDYAEARRLMDGKLTPFLEDTTEAKMLSDALKIVINSVYGLTSASFPNVFKDTRNKDNIVAKRGALFMIDLKHAVQERGLRAIHIKTDSIKIPGATDDDIKFVIDFGAKYGYEFEHEGTYKKMALVNDAVFIARDSDDSWKAVGAEFQHPYIFKTLFSKQDIDFEDYFEAKSIQKGAMYLDFADEPSETFVDNENVRFIGRTGQFVAVREGTGGGRLLRVVEEKPFAVSGTKGYFWKEIEAAKFDDLDMDYYSKLTKKAVATIEKFGSFTDFAIPF